MKRIIGFVVLIVSARVAAHGRTGGAVCDLVFAVSHVAFLA